MKTMFIKKNKIFSGNNILRSVKHSNGSIAIIVLIIGIAVLLSVSALSAYTIKDIRFAQLDDEKLKALNIAEAGISDMYSNLYKYYFSVINGGTVTLPTSPYTGELKDAAEVIGTYYVVYEPVLDTNGKISGYIINSKGTVTKSQIVRKVGVKINIIRQNGFTTFTQTEWQELVP